MDAIRRANTLSDEQLELLDELGIHFTFLLTDSAR